MLLLVRHRTRLETGEKENVGEKKQRQNELQFVLESRQSSSAGGLKMYRQMLAAIFRRSKRKAIGSAIRARD